MRYCLFSSLSHDTMDCIMTQGAGGCSRGPRHGQEALRHGPMTRPARGHDTAGLLVGASGARARVAWPWGDSRYNGLYRGWGRPLCHNMGSDTGCDTAQQRPATRRWSVATHAAARVTRRAARAWVAIQFLYRDRKGRRQGSVCERHGLRHDSVCTRHGLRHSQCALRHDWVRPRYDASASHDTT